MISKYSRRIVSVTAVVAILLVTGVVFAAILDNTGVAFGGTSSLTGPDSVCKTVTNNSPTGKQLYVPGSTAAEWQSFVSAAGSGQVSGVSLAACTQPSFAFRLLRNGNPVSGGYGNYAADGGYYVSSSAGYYDGSASRGFVAKLSPSRSVVWAQSMSTPQPSTYFGPLASLTDGGMITYVQRMLTWTNPVWSYSLVKYNSDGSIGWTREFFHSSVGNNAILKFAESSGSVMILGVTTSNVTLTGYITKLDLTSGAQAWIRTIALSSSVRPTDVLGVGSNDYLVGGYTSAGSYPYNGSPFVFHIDGSGNMSTVYTYGSGSLTPPAPAFDLESDGGTGYYFAAYKTLIRLDSALNVTWAKQYSIGGTAQLIAGVKRGTDGSLYVSLASGSFLSMVNGVVAKLDGDGSPMGAYSITGWATSDMAYSSGAGSGPFISTAATYTTGAPYLQLSDDATVGGSCAMMSATTVTASAVNVTRGTTSFSVGTSGTSFTPIALTPIDFTSGVAVESVCAGTQ